MRAGFLLDRIVARFSEVTRAAQRILAQCASACTRSCIDCLQTYRNAFYHEHLDRNEGLERLQSLGERLVRRHEIPTIHPASTPEGSRGPSNGAETKLRHLLLAAGFGEGSWQETLALGPGLPNTTPDVIFRSPHHGSEEGVLIYLDGLSGASHGDPGKAQRDRELRAWARDKGYEVIVLDVAALTHPDSMTLGAIVQTYVSAVKSGATVKLTNVSKRFRDLLAVTKLDRIMEIVEVEGDIDRQSVDTGEPETTKTRIV